MEAGRMQLLVGLAVQRHGEQNWEKVAQAVSASLAAIVCGGATRIDPSECETTFRAAIAERSPPLSALIEVLRSQHVDRLGATLANVRSEIAQLKWQLSAGRERRSSAAESLQDGNITLTQGPGLSVSVDGDASSMAAVQAVAEVDGGAHEDGLAEEPADTVKAEAPAEPSRTPAPEPRAGAGADGSSTRERTRSTGGESGGSRASAKAAQEAEADAAEIRRGGGRTRLAGPAEVVPDSDGIDSWVEVAEEERNPRRMSVQGILLKMLASITKHKWAHPFKRPVTDKEAPDYRDIIKHPMDFSTLRKRVEGGLVADVASLVADLSLIFDNAMLYNAAGSDYHKMAHTLKEVVAQQHQLYREWYLAKHMPSASLPPLTQPGAAPAPAAQAPVVAAPSPVPEPPSAAAAAPPEASAAAAAADASAARDAAATPPPAVGEELASVSAASPSEASGTGEPKAASPAAADGKDSEGGSVRGCRKRGSTAAPGPAPARRRTTR